MGKTARTVVYVAFALVVALWVYSYTQDRVLQERNKMEQEHVNSVLKFTEKTKILIAKTSAEEKRLQKLAQTYLRRARMAQTKADSLSKELAAIQLPAETPAGCEVYAHALEVCKARGDQLAKALSDMDSTHTIDSLRSDTLKSTLDSATVTIAAQDSTIKGLEKHLKPKKFLGLFHISNSAKQLGVAIVSFLVGYAAH